MLLNIAAKDRPYALTLLRWLAYAQSPLSLVELAEASIIFPSENSTNDDSVAVDDRGGWRDALDILAGLVVPVEVSGQHATSQDASLDHLADSHEDHMVMGKERITKHTTIRLAHISVKEYLESVRISRSTANSFQLDPGRDHRWITQSCLVYLIHYSRSLHKASSTQDLVIFPLLKYAAAMWHRHALLQQSLDHNREVQFLTCSSYRSCWFDVHKPDQSWRKPFENRDGHYDNIGSPVYYASLVGCEAVVQTLLAAGVDINAEGGDYGNALQAASTSGHDNVVQGLLAAGADVNTPGGDYGTALQAASDGGHEIVVQKLLAAGADVNAQGGLYGNALQAASKGGHMYVVQKLLAAGADVNAQGGFYGNAVQAASKGGHTAVVEKLLAAGAVDDRRQKMRRWNRGR